MKKIFKVIICNILMLVAVVSAVAVFPVLKKGEEKEKQALADSSNQINYVSLGDSIAVGYLLSGHNADQEPSYNASNNTYSQGVMIENSYASRFKSRLVEIFGATNVNAVTYAKSGDKVSDLLNKLNATNVVNDIANADVVTICIGANNILGPAIDNIYDYIKKDPSLTIQQMDSILDAGLETLKDTATKDGELTTLLKRLTEINPNAQYVFTTVYNPYKYLGVENDDWLDEWFLSQFINADNVNSIGAETEIYLAGGKNSSGNQVIGLNQILSKTITSWIASGYKNFTLVDTKSVFDTYSSGDYSSLVNCWITKDYNVIEMIRDLDWGSIGSQEELEQEITEAIDPHPKSGGHAILCSSFEKAIWSAKFDSCGGSDVKSQVVIKNNNLLEPVVPVKENYAFAGWYKDSGCTVPWNFSEDIVNQNVTLYAKWENLNCLNAESLNQFYKKPQAVEFQINVSTSVEWFVNDEKVYEGSNTFSFSPATDSFSYNVYAKVHGSKTNSFDINLSYYEPESLIIAVKKDGKKYIFYINDEMAESIEPEKVVWYQKDANGGEDIEIGKGLKLSFAPEFTSDVYAVYQGSTVKLSNKLTVEPAFKIKPEHILYVIVGFTFLIVVFATIKGKKKKKIAK